jgi:hypothetical protein
MRESYRATQDSIHRGALDDWYSHYLAGKLFAAHCRRYRSRRKDEAPEAAPPTNDCCVISVSRLPPQAASILARLAPRANDRFPLA